MSDVWWVGLDFGSENQRTDEQRASTIESALAFRQQGGLERERVAVRQALAMQCKQ